METLLFISFQWPYSHIPLEGFQAFAKTLGPTFSNYLVPSLCKSLNCEGGNSITWGSLFFSYILWNISPVLAHLLAQNALYKCCWRNEYEEINLLIFFNCGIVWFEVFCCFKINFLNEKFCTSFSTHSERTAMLRALLKYL